jgi:hypothetical protein
MLELLSEARHSPVESRGDRVRFRQEAARPLNDCAGLLDQDAVHSTVGVLDRQHPVRYVRIVPGWNDPA